MVGQALQTLGVLGLLGEAAAQRCAEEFADIPCGQTGWPFPSHDPAVGTIDDDGPPALLTGPKLAGGDVARPTLVGWEHGHFALVASSGPLGPMARRGQPGWAFEVLRDGLAMAAEALASQPCLDAPIPVAGRTRGQHRLDGCGQLPTTSRARPTRWPVIIEPTAGHAERAAGQNDGSVELSGQTYYIPSGNRSSLSSQNFFKRSTASAWRPKARSSASSLRGSGSRRLFGMSSPWSRKP